MRLSSKANIAVALFLAGGLWSCAARSKKAATAPSENVTAADNEDEEPFIIPDIPDPMANKNNTPSIAATAAQKAIINGMTLKAGYNNNSLGKAYTGFDGTNTYKIVINIEIYGEPAAASVSAEELVEVTRTNEYKALVEPEKAQIALDFDPTFWSVRLLGEYTGGRLYELTTLKSGSTVVKGKWGSTDLSPIAATIAAYNAGSVAAGKQRYNAAVAGATPSPSCASCHQTATGVDHSPFRMAVYSDAALLSTIKTGLNTDENSNTSVPHNMTFANSAEEQGIVAYLRTLDPYKKP